MLLAILCLVVVWVLHMLLLVLLVLVLLWLLPGRVVDPVTGLCICHWG
jgi:hypothetical protein